MPMWSDRYGAADDLGNFVHVASFTPLTVNTIITLHLVVQDFESKGNDITRSV